MPARENTELAPLEQSLIPLLLAVGALYLLAIGAGRLCASVRVPRVTGYLGVGLLTGPSAAGLVGLPPVITHDQIHSLVQLHDLALGVIIFAIGGTFHVRVMRRFGLRILKVSALEIGLTVVLVGAIVLAVGGSSAVAGFLAIMAMTTAPAATQMVVREYESEGPLTDMVMTLIGLDNLVAITVFVFVFHFVVTPDASMSQVYFELGVPLAVGAAAGLTMAVMDQRLTRLVERQLLGLSMVAGIVGLCQYLDVSPMPATLVAGAVLVNSSPHDQRLLEDLRGLDYPLYVIFFVMAGAELRLELIPHMGAIGIAYVLARSVGKYVGCRTGAIVARAPASVRIWLGPAMLAQAGLAIGLAATLARGWGEAGRQIQTAVLASVVVFEGIGPLLTRIALVRAGEVTVLSLLNQRAPVGFVEGLHEVVEHFRDALGLKRSFKKASDILIAHVMRRNVEVVPEGAPFNSLLHTMGHSRYDRLPVVNAEAELVGVIQYSDISEILFDPYMSHVLVAGDIASREHFILTPSDSLEKAMNELRAHPDHTYLLVVADDDPKKLVGVVRHNDVLSAQRRLGKST